MSASTEPLFSVHYCASQPHTATTYIAEASVNESSIFANLLVRSLGPMGKVNTVAKF